jgi:hypothetical protein
MDSCAVIFLFHWNPSTIGNEMEVEIFIASHGFFISNIQTTMARAYLCKGNSIIVYGFTISNIQARKMQTINYSCGRLWKWKKKARDPGYESIFYSRPRH